MRIVKLEWHVLRWDFNQGLKAYNVFSNSTVEDIRKLRKNGKIQTRQDLKEWLKRDLMYHYWSKAEHEMVVGPLFGKDIAKYEKVDVWRQLEPNLDNITDYIIGAMGLRLKGGTQNANKD